MRRPSGTACSRRAAAPPPGREGCGRRVRELTDAVRAEGFSDAEYRQAKDRYDRAVGALREAELAVVEARGELNRAEDDLAEAKRRVAERAQRERQIAAHKARQRLH